MSRACPGRLPSSRMDATFQKKRRIWQTSAGKDGMGLRRRSTSCAATASKSAHTRARERLADIRPLVIADAEATELIQPSKGPLDDPAPPAQPAPVLGAAHSDQRLDMPRAAHAEWQLRRSHDPRAHSLAAVAVAPVRPAAGESHRPAPGL